MKIVVEFDNQTLVDCLLGAHSRYWAKSESLKISLITVGDPETINGSVIESESDTGYSKKHNLDVKLGLQRLAKYSSNLFALLMDGQYDGVTGDVLLQLSAGIMYQDGPKYG